MDRKRQLNGEVDSKSGEVMAKSKKPKKRLPKTHKDYWRQRVFKLTYKDKATGEKKDADNYSVRLTHQKRREYFNLESSNKLDAGDEAKRIYYFLKANGWAATLAKYKPEAEEEPEIATIGDLIRVAEQKADIRERTMQGYRSSIRKLAGAIKGIKSEDSSKYRPGGGDWQKKVDEVKLQLITASNVQAWKKKQLGAAKKNPKKQKQIEISVDTVINHSRSIWKHSGLPSPFEGMKWKQTTKRYKPEVKAPVLLHYAKEELEKQEPEQFRAFALCLYFGLRKREADCLTWEQIDFDNSELRIEETDYFKPKSEDSKREIPIQESLLKDISKWRKNADKVFVLHGGEAKPEASYPYYRAKKTWKGLAAWLRSKGITSPKPIHDLRKLSISLVYAASDIYGAQAFGGHADIRTTIGSYVHKKPEAPEILPEKPEPRVVEG